MRSFDSIQCPVSFTPATDAAPVIPKPAPRSPLRRGARQMRLATGRYLTRLLRDGAKGWPRRGVMTTEQAMGLLGQSPLADAPRGARVFTAEVVRTIKLLLRENPGLSAKQVHWRLVELRFPMGSERATRMVVAAIRRGRR